MSVLTYGFKYSTHTLGFQEVKKGEFSGGRNLNNHQKELSWISVKPDMYARPGTYQTSLSHLNSFCNEGYVMEEQLDRKAWLGNTFRGYKEDAGIFVGLSLDPAGFFFFSSFFLSASCSTHRACRCCLLAGRERYPYIITLAGI